jgi:hypothetical protein|tara:strand:+ start:987 stop:1097 length:111 start_codon:yes stop_codon:yes gene_type:complete
MDTFTHQVILDRLYLIKISQQTMEKTGIFCAEGCLA